MWHTKCLMSSLTPNFSLCILPSSLKVGPPFLCMGHSFAFSYFRSALGFVWFFNQKTVSWGGHWHCCEYNVPNKALVNRQSQPKNGKLKNLINCFLTNSPQILRTVLIPEVPWLIIQRSYRQILTHHSIHRKLTIINANFLLKVAYWHNLLTFKITSIIQNCHFFHKNISIRKCSRRESGISVGRDNMCCMSQNNRIQSQ